MLTCGDGDPDCVPPVKAGIKTRHSYVIFIPQSSTLHSVFLNFFFSLLYVDLQLTYLSGQREETQPQKKRGDEKHLSRSVMEHDIVGLSFGRRSASGCQTSHWYGCHGKSTGLVHARQEENLMCCHSWICFILVLEIHLSNAGTWEEWITPAICQLIRRFPPSAAQTYRGYCPFFLQYVCAGARVLIRKELNPL